jgi:hypothetical protein
VREVGRVRGEPKAKQAGRQAAQAHGHLPRKSKVQASVGRNGEIWLSLPDERGHQVISMDEDIS